VSRPALAGRTALITGASQGLGLEIARAFVTAGASVVLCARDAAVLDAARGAVAALAGKGQTVDALGADVSRPDDVQELAEVALARLGRIDILVNNAGVYGPIGALEQVDWSEWVRAMEINVYGSVLPIRALLPHMKSNRYGKIVQLSGGGATNPLPRISAYAASKAAIVRLAETLAEEVRDWRIDVNAIAPGALDTRLLDQVIAAGPERVGHRFYERMQAIKTQGGTPLDKGAALAVFLASADSDGLTGRLISAVWDPWPRLPELRDELGATDIYTLRRITPADRGRNWETT
jgi:NAD(P)-dependent dehydrogenase (short-subunit alcohol dehydrogenase family)